MNTDFYKLTAQFKCQIEEWDKRYSLSKLSCYQNLNYKLVRTIVYNSHLDKIKPGDIKIILVGDNPGMNEQAENAYLVGKSGKMAANFFKEVYDYDFYKNILIMNKTPVHTKSTSQLKEIYKTYPEFLETSQRYMAELVFKFSSILKVPVFVTGFAGCRTPDGIWLKKSKKGYNLNSQTAPFFFEQLKVSFRNNHGNLFLFKHFSYGNFYRDIKAFITQGVKTEDAVLQTGMIYRNELFGVNITGLL